MTIRTLSKRLADLERVSAAEEQDVIVTVDGGMPPAQALYMAMIRRTTPAPATYRLQDRDGSAIRLPAAPVDPWPALEACKNFRFS